MEEIKLCDYGCGQEAKFQMKNGKWCCENFYNKCPSIINKTKNFGSKNGSFGKPCWTKGLTKETDLRVLKISTSNMGKKNSEIHNLRISIGQKGKVIKPEAVKKISEALKGRPSKNKGKRLKMLSYYLKKCPDLFKYEKIIEDSKTNELIVQCKSCGVKYKPRRGDVTYRIKMIKNGDLHRGVFYCSSGCKEGFLYKDKEQFECYSNRVIKETYKSVKKNQDKIKNIELRSAKFHLDHKYSIIEGFKNKVDIKIIAHWKNLEVIPWLDNNKKCKKCSITLEKLIEEIQTENV